MKNCVYCNKKPRLSNFFYTTTLKHDCKDRNFQMSFSCTDFNVIKKIRENHLIDQWDNLMKE